MDIKLIFSITGATVGTVAFFPYLRNILQRKTRPHIYTWIILAITQGIGVLGIWYGGGKWGVVWLAINTVFACAVILLSFRYGTKNITTTDTIILVATLAAIVAWWKLRNPYLSVLLASAIDIAAGIPTIRKSYYEPWSETVSLWICFIIANFLTIAALKEYNFLTVWYLAAINIGNVTLVVICLLRRPSVAEPTK